jgi:hypothetical protein
MYYAHDRTCSAISLIFFTGTMICCILCSYLIFTTFNEQNCLIVDILNLTNGNIYDIVFLVNRTLTNTTDIAYGSYYYEIGEYYACKMINDVVVLNAPLDYANTIQGLSITISTVLTICTAGILFWTIKVYFCDKNYIYFH